MTLSKNEIIKRLNHDVISDKTIVVTPILDREDQIGISSIDVRLGHQFIIFKEHYKEQFSPLDHSIPNENKIKKYQEEIFIKQGSFITLHPGKLIIASTFEYISMPFDIECQVEGRSSWARLGLIIATATTIEPGYKGVVTLELSNVGSLPIKLYPEVKIAQLVFHKIEGPTEKATQSNKYNLSIGPGFSKVYLDKHRNYFCKEVK